MKHWTGFLSTGRATKVWDTNNTYKCKNLASVCLLIVFCLFVLIKWAQLL